MDGRRGWNNERVIVFTEYRDTQVWLEQLLTVGPRWRPPRLLYGGMDTDARERIKAEFQHSPTRFPTYLLATDAASEASTSSVTATDSCTSKSRFHPHDSSSATVVFDRHGQSAPDVLIHHFVGEGWDGHRLAVWKLTLGSSRLSPIRSKPSVGTSAPSASAGPRSRAQDARTFSRRRPSPPAPTATQAAAC